MLRRKLLCAAVLTAVSVVGAAGIKNASFTEGTTMPTDWGLSHEGNPSNVTAARDASVYATAPASLRLQGGPSGHTEGFVMQMLPTAAIAGKTLTITGKGKASNGFVCAVVQPFLKDGTNSWGHMGVIDSRDWADWSFEFTFPPASTLQFAFLNFFVDTPGSLVWVDDVSLEVAGVRVKLTQAPHAVASTAVRSLCVAPNGRMVDVGVAAQLAPGLRLLRPEAGAVTARVVVPR